VVKDSMTPEERILAAVHLEPYDRVPVAPLLSPSFPFLRKGLHTLDAYSRNVALDGTQAMVDLYDEVGGFDGLVELITFPALPPTSSIYHFYRFYYRTMRFPGVDRRLSDDSSPQFAEKEMVQPVDYDEILRVGWREFMEKNSARIAGSAPPPVDVRIARGKTQTAEYLRQREVWRKKGAVVLNGFAGMDPQMALTLLRTLPQFSLDVYRRPDKVKAVIDAWVDDFACDFLAAANEAREDHPRGLPGIMMACERGSATYFNLKIFEKFVWPPIKTLVETWYAHGYITTLHFDTNWTQNLPYLLQLPPRSCIVELDSTTDIFKAKEILKDHMCIMGDIPPQLSAYGTPADMEAYCKKLIDVVGKGGGFILSTGCEQPPDTKYENFKVMIDTAKNYYPHKPRG